jgi:hypothetical protein
VRAGASLFVREKADGRGRRREEKKRKKEKEGKEEKKRKNMEKFPNLKISEKIKDNL